jgi:hypothetical protein
MIIAVIAASIGFIFGVLVCDAAYKQIDKEEKDEHKT